MYPLNAPSPWPRNQWYVAALSADFGQQPIERTILGERVLLYRTETGQPVAMAGLCPHRFMPLAKGQRRGDVIECPYHGMAFDAGGKCVAGPAGSPAAGSLRRYPIVETEPLVWIWTGEPGLADPDLLPDVGVAGIGVEGWRADPNGLMHFGGRFMLLVDNLFDLSHIGWVHASIVGALPICRQKPSISQDRGLLHFERRDIGGVDPFTRFLFPDAVGPLEHVLATTMLGPGLITAIGPSVSEAEGSPLSGAHLGQIQFVHALTPETMHSTNVHTVVTRNFRLEDDALSQALCEQNLAVLAQDKEVAESIERALASAQTREELSFRTDRGGIEARRIIAALVQNEFETAAKAAA